MSDSTIRIVATAVAVAASAGFGGGVFAEPAQAPASTDAIARQAEDASLVQSIGDSVSSQIKDGVDSSTEVKMKTITALKDFNFGQESALKSLAEKLKSADLGMDDAKLLDELLQTGRATLDDMQDNALTPEQVAYFKPVQVHRK